jgi:hypothetical protein
VEAEDFASFDSSLAAFPTEDAASADDANDEDEDEDEDEDDADERRRL